MKLILDLAVSGYDSDPFDEDVCNALTVLWADEGVQEAHARRDEYNLSDSAA